MSIVTGDAALMAEIAGPGDPLKRLRSQFLEDELVHLLVSTAVANRIHEEHMHSLRTNPDELAFTELVHECGLLQPDVTADDEVPLSFREACNKIVHADHVTAETDGDPDENSIPTTIVLRGMLGRKAWIAYLNIIEYVRASTKNFDDIL